MVVPKPDPSVVDRAAAAAEGARARLGAQAMVKLEAQRAAERAKGGLDVAIRRAASGETGQTPTEAQRVLKEADDALTLAEKLEDAMREAANQAEAAHRAAEPEAWQPVLAAGARERIAACQDYATALAGLRAAIARSEAGTAAIRSALDHRCVLGFDGAKLAPLHHSGPGTERQPAEFQRSLRTPRDEAALWEAVL